MKKRYATLLFIGLFTFMPRTYAQIVLQSNLSAETLVNQFFNSGVLVSLSNITFNGIPAELAPNEQIALFSNGLSDSLGVESGLIMAATNVNWLADYSLFFQGEQFSDPDLAVLGGGPSYTCAVIEFDVLVEADMLAFTYFFASAEYQSYTCSIFNDAFGFFISGPGINGPFSNNSKNIATIPGTETPIAINTVNSGSSTGGGESTICEAANPNWQADSQYFVQNIAYVASSINTNGYTLPFEAIVDVINGETYHMKLAVCNIMDIALPSAVFFEEGSFEGRLASKTVNPIAIDLNIYPNPTTDALYLTDLCKNCSENVSISFMNLQGREVARHSVAPQGQIEVPMHELENGLYIITAYKGQQMIGRSKVVKR